MAHLLPDFFSFYQNHSLPLLSAASNTTNNNCILSFYFILDITLRVSICFFLSFQDNIMVFLFCFFFFHLEDKNLQFRNVHYKVPNKWWLYLNSGLPDSKFHVSPPTLLHCQEMLKSVGKTAIESWKDSNLNSLLHRKGGTSWNFSSYYFFFCFIIIVNM